MSRKIKLWKDPYDCGIKLFKKKSIEIRSGITILVGCNGIGKSTLLNNIEEELRKEKIPCALFNNLQEGGSKSYSEKLFIGDFGSIAERMTSSEGENIIINMYEFLGKVFNFIKKGEYKRVNNPFDKIFKKSNEEKEISEVKNERWILLDAIDSGLSIDNIIYIKEVFKTLISHEKDNAIYIIISANEYEMANGEKCFDVYNGKYIEFKNYEEYKNMIIESRKLKENRKNINV